MKKAFLCLDPMSLIDTDISYQILVNLCNTDYRGKKWSQIIVNKLSGIKNSCFFILLMSKKLRIYTNPVGIITVHMKSERTSLLQALL